MTCSEETRKERKKECVCVVPSLSRTNCPARVLGGDDGCLHDLAHVGAQARVFLQQLPHKFTRRAGHLKGGRATSSINMYFKKKEEEEEQQQQRRVGYLVVVEVSRTLKYLKVSVFYLGHIKETDCSRPRPMQFKSEVAETCVFQLTSKQEWNERADPST